MNGIALPSRMLRNAFDNAGYLEVDHDRWTWSMARDRDESPFTIPRTGGLVSASIVEGALNHNNDEALRNQVLAQMMQFAQSTGQASQPQGKRPPSEPPSEK